MDIPSTVTSLKRKIRAAQEELRAAIDFHEAWQPTAYNSDLHSRMGKSLATNTFLIIRAALRREMLLTLTRLWDTDRRAVGLESIANTLKDERVVSVLAADCEAQWTNQPIYSFGDDDLTPDAQASIKRIFEKSEQEFAKKQSTLMRQKITEALEIIASYGKNGPKHPTLKHLMMLRNEKLAHRQITPSKPTIDSKDVDIETFYQDMMVVIHNLLLAVENTHYDPADTADVKRRHAELFWETPCGETNDKHPKYKVHPNLRS